MNNLALFNDAAQPGKATMSTREIAELTGKQHKHVLDDSRKMLEDLGLTLADFSADLPDVYGRLQPVFLLPKRESLILVSGYSTELRARIIDRWEALESGRELPSTQYVSGAATTPLGQDLEALQILANWLNVAPSGQIGMARVALSHHAPHLLPALPGYAIDAPKQGATVSGSSEPTFSLTHLLQEHGVAITAAKFNAMLHDAGIIERRVRDSTKPPGMKTFWSVTDKGIPFGKNVSSDKNQRETQPHWYASKFAELLDLVRSQY